MRTKDEFLDSHKKITLLCYLVNSLWSLPSALQGLPTQYMNSDMISLGVSGSRCIISPSAVIPKFRIMNS